MDTVLIVLEDAEIRDGLQRSLQALTGLGVIAAQDEKTGLERLAGETVDLLVTELTFAQGDGLALIAFLSANRAGTPCVVLTERLPPGAAQWREGLCCLAMPFESFQLAAVVREGLTRRGEAVGMSLRPLLPLVAAARKTCRLEAGAGEGRKGYLYFENGELNEAHCGALRGRAAALAMLAWGAVRIRFGSLPARRAGRRLPQSLESLMRMVQGPPQSAPARAVEPPPPPPERHYPAAEKARLQEALAGHLPLLRGVKGYQTVGVVSDEGQILAADAAESDGPAALPYLAAILHRVFKPARIAAGRAGMEDCQGLSVHSADAVVLVSGAAASPESGLYLFGVVDPAGNWFFLKTQLDKVAPEILAPAG
jgi:DNA-binding response OmpR family regulator